jgi:formylglycine-generating enzyme required for sulfatase activity
MKLSRRRLFRNVAAVSTFCLAPQFDALFALVADNQSKSIEELDRLLIKPFPPPSHEAALCQAAVSKAEAAIELLRRGELKHFLPLLECSSDPTLRSYIVDRIGKSHIDSTILLRLLRNPDTSVGQKRALILALGTYAPSELPPSTTADVVTTFLDWYGNNPDAGIHAAIQWLFRSAQRNGNPIPTFAQQAAKLDSIDKGLQGVSADNHGWSINSAGHTMVTIAGGEFIMGSPGYEVGRFKDEIQHRVRIPRTFAVAQCEITIEQFERFLDNYPELRARFVKEMEQRWHHLFKAPEAAQFGFPIVSITWYECAKYCNWLNERESIPESEWCFPPINEIEDGMRLPENYLHRKGYRLLTEAEWEYAARSGTTSSRYFGYSEDLLPKYAWYEGNSKDADETSVGSFKPTDNGLFDILGNAWEWCLDRRRPYPFGSGVVLEDWEDQDRLVSNQVPRTRRGGSFTYASNSVRSACRGDVTYFPMQRRDSVGFRIARTL